MKCDWAKHQKMYIQKVEIENIRSISHFSMEFPNPAGWHVLIGDNGSGKTTIIRSIALALVGAQQSQGLRANWGEWLSKRESLGSISLDLSGPHLLQTIKKIMAVRESGMFSDGLFRSTKNKLTISRVNGVPALKEDSENWTDEGWFSVAFGPYRRFEGGDAEWQKMFENRSYAKLAAHLSVFGEDVALTETTKWLVRLYNTSNDPIFPQDQIESQSVLRYLQGLLNSQDKDGSFLPHDTKLESVNSKGVVFKDGNGATIAVNQLSDGYRSILSLTFELIRQLVRVYGSDVVFSNVEKGEMFIDLPGVVLVDEIDAHLHPTWQTRIGQWFTKYFPQLQFIVTTHSPLVCRACERGSIWRLAAPGSDDESGEVTGTERDRLIYGNVLDAYGTEVFGAVTINPESVEKKEELVELNKKKMAGVIAPEEESKLEQLRKTFTTDDPIDL
jgi:predicted ATPase